MAEQLQVSEFKVSAWIEELSPDKQLFLSYTPACRLGPGLPHNGCQQEHMEFPGDQWETASRIIRQKSETWRVGKPNERNECKDTDRECDHCSYFRYLAGGKWKIVGMQSCGNLTMNRLFFSFYNPSLTPYANRDQRPRGLVHMGSAPPSRDRPVPCLLKWVAEDGPKYTIQEVYFDANNQNCCTYIEPRKGIALEHYLGGSRRHRLNYINLVNLLEFAVSGKQVIRNRQLVPLQYIAEQFDDMRHLFRLPELPESIYWPAENKNRSWKDTHHS